MWISINDAKALIKTLEGSRKILCAVSNLPIPKKARVDLNKAINVTSHYISYLSEGVKKDENV